MMLRSRWPGTAASDTLDSLLSSRLLAGVASRREKKQLLAPLQTNVAFGPGEVYFGHHGDKVDRVRNSGKDNCFGNPLIVGLDLFWIIHWGGGKAFLVLKY